MLQKILDSRHIIIVGLIILLTLKTCNTPGLPKVQDRVVLSHKVDTVYKPVNKIVYKKGKDIYKVRKEIVQIPTVVDTIKLISDYYAYSIHYDTLDIPEYKGKLTITDSISENTITHRDYKLSLNLPTITETTVVQAPAKRYLSVGGNLGIEPANRLLIVTPTLTYTNRKQTTYSLGVGLTSTGSTHYQVGTYFKLF